MSDGLGEIGAFSQVPEDAADSSRTSRKRREAPSDNKTERVFRQKPNETRPQVGAKRKGERQIEANMQPLEEEQAIERVSKRALTQTSDKKIREAIDAKTGHLAIELIRQKKGSFDHDTWLDLFDAACLTQNQPVVEELLEKIPRRLPATTIHHALRKSVEVSDAATIKIINIASSTTLKSPLLRDFLFGCKIRAERKQGAEDQVLQALKDKGIVIEQLYPAKIEASYIAGIGQVRQIALKMIQKQQQNPAPLEAKIASSAQKVALIPKEGLVLKQRSDKAREDEVRVISLFQLSGAKEIMASADFKDLNPQRLGLSGRTPDFSFTPDDFDQSRAKLVASRLERTEREQFLTAVRSEEKREGKKAYKDLCESHSFELYVNKKRREIPFERLCNMIIHGMITPENVIYCDGKPVNLERELLSDSPMKRAIEYRASPKKGEELYLVPDTAGLEESFQKMLKSTWKVRSAAGVETLSFRELQKAYLEGKITSRTYVSPKDEISFSPIQSCSELMQTLSIPWRLRSPQTEIQGIPDVSFTNIQAKPFAKGMKLVGEMDDAFKEAAFERLDANSEINAIFLTEFQLYDLHDGNLGLSVKPSDSNAAFLDASFQIGRSAKSITFAQLLEMHITGKLGKSDRIKMVHSGPEKLGRLSDFPELVSALDSSRYQFVIFDVDINFAETNGVHFTDIEEDATGHLVPFRSCLLELEFKDKLLSPEALQFLDNSAARDSRVIDWLTSRSSIIYTRMRPEAREPIASLVEAFARNPKYSLSLYRHKEGTFDVTVEGIRDRFKKDMGKCDTPLLQQFWHTIQDALQNSMPEGAPNLLGDGDDSIELRERIAMQLFPQATMYQIDALRERQTLRNGYLQSYRELRLMDPEKSNRELLAEIIQRRSTPLSGFQRQELLKQLAKSPQEAHQSLLKLIEPTQCNLMKATYPLMADMLEGLMELNPDIKEAGSTIGYYNYTVEMLQGELKKKLASQKRTERQHILRIKTKLNCLEAALSAEIERSKIRNAQNEAVCDPYF